MSTLSLSFLRMALPDQAVTPPLDRDSAILERITKGDPDAYRLIMQRYRDHVAAIVAGYDVGRRVRTSYPSPFAHRQGAIRSDR